MNITITERAHIALEHLPPPEKKRAMRFLAQLEGFPNSEVLRGEIYKAPSIDGKTIFIGKLGLAYRLLFRQVDQEIVIFEIVHHDRLKRFLGWNDGGLR